MKRPLYVFLISLSLILVGQNNAYFQPKPVEPGKGDKCIVCGMFCWKYPKWAPQIHFKDGRVEHFCSVKCLFTLYLNLDKFKLGKDKKRYKNEDVVVLYVRNFYDLKWADAKKCFFVINSDVYGPMGRALIPHNRPIEVETFLEDHGGQVVPFDEVTNDLITELSKGEKMIKIK